MNIYYRKECLFMWYKYATTCIAIALHFIVKFAFYHNNLDCCKPLLLVIKYF